MRQLLTAGLSLVLVMGVAFSSQGQSLALDAPTPNLAAQEIIARSIAVYANCTSYVDEGEVKTIFLESNGPRTVIKPFTTAFVRPSAFRFEYKELRGLLRPPTPQEAGSSELGARNRGLEEWSPGLEQRSNYIIWADGEVVKTWWSIKPGVENPPNLAMALAAATGVSSMSSFTVPTLLMPETNMGNPLKSFSALKLQEQEIDGRQAYKIEGTDGRKFPVTFWLDKETLLIVKTFRKVRFPDFATETTTTYRPKINAGAEGKLAFNAPGTGKKGF
jgi:hypothetical protein